jgi:hypothetical protein
MYLFVVSQGSVLRANARYFHAFKFSWARQEDLDSHLAASRASAQKGTCFVCG